ncbi:hypothetical protein J2X32_001794 [Rheinheimera pacifica]|uniref:hypothetical protein n=1 Tax=Rheinheimera pacifica TaxID=173990 RepID=UPI00285D83FE|nr:hypothetical protein [Rheinheimera pacifica]MDR6983160.1 hypothetical protein [Rheinheimera pacifica]
MSKEMLDALVVQRKAIAQRLEALDQEIYRTIAEQQRQGFHALSSATLKHIINENKGSLKVTDALMLSDISPATYYKTINEPFSVKVNSLQAVLDTVGLQLYVGPKQATQKDK